MAMPSAKLVSGTSVQNQTWIFPLPTSTMSREVNIGFRSKGARRSTERRRISPGSPSCAAFSPRQSQCRHSARAFFQEAWSLLQRLSVIFLARGYLEANRVVLSEDCSPLAFSACAAALRGAAAPGSYSSTYCKSAVNSPERSVAGSGSSAPWSNKRELSAEPAKIEADFRRWRAHEIEAHELSDCPPLPTSLLGSSWRRTSNRTPILRCNSPWTDPGGGSRR